MKPCLWLVGLQKGMNATDGTVHNSLASYMLYHDSKVIEAPEDSSDVIFRARHQGKEEYGRTCPPSIFSKHSKNVSLEEGRQGEMLQGEVLHRR